MDNKGKTGKSGSGGVGKKSHLHPSDLIALGSGKGSGSSTSGSTVVGGGSNVSQPRPSGTTGSKVSSSSSGIHN